MSKTIAAIALPALGKDSYFLDEASSWTCSVRLNCIHCGRAIRLEDEVLGFLRLLDEVL